MKRGILFLIVLILTTLTIDAIFVLPKFTPHITGKTISDLNQEVFGYYTFNDTLKGEVGADFLLMNGTTKYGPGVNNRSFYFDGYTYIRLSSNAMRMSPSYTLDELTIAFWIKALSPNMLIYKMDSKEDNYRGFALQLTQEGLKLWAGGIQSDGSYDWMFCPSNILGEWHHITLTMKEGENKSIYIDGNLCVTNPTGAYGLESTRNFFFGYIKGNVDELKLWKRALNKSEVNEIAHEFTPPSPCTNECNQGAKTCEGNGYKVCQDSNYDGCYEWSSVIACQQNQTCKDGNCIEVSQQNSSTNTSTQTNNTSSTSSSQNTGSTTTNQTSNESSEIPMPSFIFSSLSDFDIPEDYSLPDASSLSSPSTNQSKTKNQQSKTAHPNQSTQQSNLSKKSNHTSKRIKARMIFCADESCNTKINLSKFSGSNEIYLNFNVKPEDVNIKTTIEDPDGIIRTVKEYPAPLKFEKEGEYIITMTLSKPGYKTLKIVKKLGLKERDTSKKIYLLIVVFFIVMIIITTIVLLFKLSQQHTPYS